jgi:hypothetical protein
MHPDSIKYTAVNTPLGLYEWLVMPQGLRNAMSVQQHHVTAALRSLIGKICHVYLDDIIIWSQDVEEHEKHIREVFETLRKNSRQSFSSTVLISWVTGSPHAESKLTQRKSKE